MSTEELELTILMPCLNEAETLQICIEKAKSFLSTSGVLGEVLIADNGSTDGSQKIAENCGARVINVPNRGYGSALNAGIFAANSKYVIMGDADDSYDFTDLSPFLNALRAGNELVMGNRFKGGIEKGAMPFLHKYVGNPILSWVGRLFFKTSIGDFHCGLRAFKRKRILSLNLKSTGMEFASEIVVSSIMNNLKISEVPTTLRKDGRSRPPHLRTWRDGYRHLRFLLLYSPRWLLLYPGIFVLIMSLIIFGISDLTTVNLIGIRFGFDSLLVSLTGVFLGMQIIYFAFCAKLIGEVKGYLQPNPNFNRFLKIWSLERVITLTLILGIAGAILFIYSLNTWRLKNFGQLNLRQQVSITAPSVLFIVVAIQTFFSRILLELIDL